MQEYIKKILGSGRSSSSPLQTTTLIISNDEMKYIIEIVESLEEEIQYEAKEQTDAFLSMLLGTLSATVLGNILTGKGINRTGEGTISKRQDQGIVRAGYGNKKTSKSNSNKTRS